MKTLKIQLSLLVLATMVFTSCKKDSVTPSLSADALNASSASTLSEQTLADLQTMGDEATGTSLKSISLLDSVIVPNRDRFKLNGDTTSIVIDFGTGTTCRDGKERKGKLTITRTKSPSKDRDGVITTTTDGYEVNGNSVSLTKTVTGLGWATDNTYPNGYLKFSVTVVNGTITRPNGDVVTVNVDHTRKLLSNAAKTGFIGWAISGTSSHNVILAANGKTLSVATHITIDLLRPRKYHHFIAGQTVSEFLSGKIVTVDFGDGILTDPSTWKTRQVTTSDDAEVTTTQE